MLLVAIAVLVSRGNTTNVSLSLPVRFDLDPSTYRIQGAGGGAVDARIEDATGHVTVRGGSMTSGLLRAGTRLLLYTDGITEAENRTGEQFGAERLEAAIGGPGQSEPPRVLNAIIETVVGFRGTARQSDDMTMMLVSREIVT